MSRTRILIGIAAALAFQVTILTHMVWTQVTLLQSPIEAVLKTEPVDPRDIFRGDYVTLWYEAGNLSTDTVPLDAEVEAGDDVYVVLRLDTPYATPARALALRPESLADNEAVIRGTLRWSPRLRRVAEGDECEGEDCLAYGVAYPIDSYFVPEGTGGEIEEYRDERALGIIVALNADGDAAIKGLMMDGRKVYDEPLF